VFRKLNTKKKWITLDKLTEYMALFYEERITRSDVYQLAIEKELTLSVRFPSSVRAQECTFVDLDQSKFMIRYLGPSLSESLKHPFVLAEDLKPTELTQIRTLIAQQQLKLPTSITLEFKTHLNSKQNTKDCNDFYKLIDSLYPQGRASIQVLDHYFEDESVYISSEDKSFIDIDGVWDLLPTGAATLYMEKKYQEIENGYNLDQISLDGLFLRNSDTNQVAMLLEQNDGEYQPTTVTPKSSSLVVRTKELKKLFSNESVDVDISSRKEATYLKYIALLTKAYASKAGPIYGSSEVPNKSKIFEELVKQMPEERIHGISSTSFSDHVKEGLNHLE